MTQYCRYCMYFVCGNGEYCEAKNWEPTERYAKSPNRCKEFELNPIDAYGENLNGYRPREARPKVTPDGYQFKQVKLEDIVNENQAG